MNPMLLSLTDGTSFFVGLAMVAIGQTLLAGLTNRIGRSLLTILVLLGIVLVLISATPLPLWLYAAWAIVAAGSLVLGGLQRLSRSVRAGATCLAVVLSLALCLIEIPYHRRPTPVLVGGRTVYVLGDSISAGAGGPSSIRLWPAVLAERESLAVVNLAQPGATIQSAMKQVDGVATSGSIVIVEIGGNDLLGGTDSADFRRRLKTLLSKLSADGHTILMFELPLLPFQNDFGRAQRDLAAKHGVTLIPKRCLTRVLGTKDGTLDGLHLSQKGHDAMADLMSEIVQR